MAVSQRAAGWPGLWPWVCLVLVAGAGATLALGPPWSAILFGLAVATLGGLLLYQVAGSSVFAVEVPLVLLLTSTMVWRVRASTELASNPLDIVGTVRTGQVLLAGLLGGLAMVQPWAHGARTPLPTPWRLYGAYVAVVFLGAPLSVNPALTAYRGVELAVGLVVLLGARRAAPRSLARVERTLYWTTVAGLANIWAGVIYAPSLAIAHLSNAPVPIPLQIQGVFPQTSSNSVGLTGVLLVFWTIGRAPHRWPGRRWWPAALATLGLVSLLAAQYRTGYVIFAAALAVLLALRRRWPLLVLVVVLLGCFLAYNPCVLTAVEPYALRGETFEQAKGLNSRVSWWSAALPAWRESPLIGKGLLTGTRFEVLPRLGLTQLSTIHGTWIEALVGTGLIGCGLLALAYVSALGQAIRGSEQLAVLLLVVIWVRSLTAPSIESFSSLILVFLWAASNSPPDPDRVCQSADGLGSGTTWTPTSQPSDD